MSAAALSGMHIAMLSGGRSSERAVSLDSGAAVATALRHSGCELTTLDTADQDWLMQLLACNADCVFIALHGGEGENGSIQGLLQTLGIHYTGSGVLASALAIDKRRCKDMWRGIGLPTAAFAMLEADTDFAAVIDELGPVMVKPVSEGSSVGMKRAETAAELKAAWRDAVQFDDAVMAEQWLSGSEFTVAIVAGQTLPAIRIEPASGFYDYHAKYIADSTQYHCPAGLSAAEEAELGALARAAYNSVGCRDWGRVDAMLDGAGNFQLLEVNTVPGMTGHSLVPMAAKAAGMSFDELVVAIVNAARGRMQEVSVGH